MKIDWINGFAAGNKKEKYNLEIRFATITIFEIKLDKKGFRFMIFNVGFEI
jgi:hypothetical protein|tara:strand:- start:8483 stop:8635 length:153 start_codon:yes stop_codon:yes gene_type:complete